LLRGISIESSEIVINRIKAATKEDEKEKAERKRKNEKKERQKEREKGERLAEA